MIKTDRELSRPDCKLGCLLIAWDVRRFVLSYHSFTLLAQESIKHKCGMKVKGLAIYPLLSITS